MSLLGYANGFAMDGVLSAGVVGSPEMLWVNQGPAGASRGTEIRICGEGRAAVGLCPTMSPGWHSCFFPRASVRPSQSGKVDVNGVTDLPWLVLKVLPPTSTAALLGRVE